MKKKQTNCYCDAYSFVHRMYGGRCEAFDPERGDEEAADRWLSGLMRRGYRTIDELLDSPTYTPYSNLGRKP